MLKRRIFLGTSLLLLALIGVITVFLAFSAMREHRLETKKHYLAVASILTGEIERLILWDDRVAIRQAIERQMEIHHLIEYTFVVLDGHPYVDSFGGSVPTSLLEVPTKNWGEDFIWEFLDPDGVIYYDFAVTMPQIKAVLRIGMKRHSVDQQIYPAIYTIALVGLGAFLIGLFFSYQIALRATREITLLCHAIQSYSNDDDVSPHCAAKKTEEVTELADSFRGLVSERKRAEKELHHLQNYLSNIIDSMPSVLIGVNTDGNITQWNGKAEQSTGISVNDAVGQSLTQVFPRLSTEMPRVREAIHNRQTLFSPKQTCPESEETCYEDITIYPLVANGVEGAVIRVDNVTERVQMEEMMVQTEKMLSIGGLAAGMAHEINNPLSIISQAAQNVIRRISTTLLANQKIADELGVDLKQIDAYLDKRDIPRFLENIESAVNRSSEIIQNMLNFSATNASQREICSIPKIIEESLTLAHSDYDLKKKHDFRNIRVETNLPEDLPEISINRIEIQQVIFNLLKNAGQAMNEVSREDYQPQITITAQADEKVLTLSLSDNGPGIPANIQTRIFEPFYTTKEVGIGTGLGLSVSYFIIVKRHQGQFQVESEEGKGTIFTIILPRGN